MMSLKKRMLKIDCEEYVYRAGDVQTFQSPLRLE